MSFPLRTHIRNANSNGYTFYPVLIIGAGASGIAMGCRLNSEIQFNDFRIFDRQSGIGGTWWINRYPGVECDVPTALYSFSFAPNFTSKSIYPSGKEYLEYLHDVAEKHHLLHKIQLDTEVTNLRYIQEDSEWEVTVICLPPGISDLPTKTRSAASKALNVELLRAKVVISCVGLLVEPNAWPEHISGKSLFEGRIVHSARWPKDLDLNEKDVLVIGSGCSAAQIVPSILNDTIVQVKSVTQILRTPPWVEPRIAEPGGKERYGRWAPKVFRYLPFLGWVVRGAIFLYTEFLWATVFQQKQSWMRRLAEKRSLAHMKGKAPEKYHAILTPRYSYGCKRRVFDNAWLESTNDARFTLTTQSLKRVEAHHAILVKEGESEEMMVKADVIVLANGFEATYLLRSLEVYGSQGNSIYEVWKENDNAQAYIGLGVHGFPNFFMTVGPNTFVGHSSVIIGIEATVSYILKMITPILKGEVDTVEPKMEAMRNWNEGIRRDLKKTIFSGCMSWYKDEKGTNSILYPRSQIDFIWRCKSLRIQDWKIVYTPEGAKKREGSKL